MTDDRRQQWTSPSGLCSLGVLLPGSCGPPRSSRGEAGLELAHMSGERACAGSGGGGGAGARPGVPPAAQPLAQPIDVLQRVLQQQRLCDSELRVASSGSGLPSALIVPSPPSPASARRAAGRPCEGSFGDLAGVSEDGRDSPGPRPRQRASGGDQLGGQQQQQQLELEQPSPPPEQQQQRLRWLPGLVAGPSAVAPETAGGARGPSGSPGTAAPDVPAAGGPGQAPTSGAASRPLPPSGSAELDRYLAYLLRDAPHKFLHYAGWGLGEAGCDAVAELLRRDSRRRLRVAELGDNAITDDGAELLAAGLASSGLAKLDLSSNKISDAGAVALAEALHENQTLVELDLSNNKIGDEGAEALAAAVASSSTLKKLQLSGNCLSARAAQVVDHVLKTREYRLPPALPSGPSSSNSFRAHMRKASSLQFNLELTESEDLRSSRQQRLQLPPALAIAALSTPSDPVEMSIAAQSAELFAEARAAGERQGAEATGADLLVSLALRLARRGFEVSLRTSCPAAADAGKQPAAAGAVARGLQHTFVVLQQPGLPDRLMPPLVVDPYFGAQFEIPHASPRYKSAVGALPDVLCLAEPRVYHLVAALCAEMAAAFNESGLSLPPWRHVAAMADKWLSSHLSFDVHVDADADSTAVAVAAAAAQRRAAEQQARR